MVESEVVFFIHSQYIGFFSGWNNPLLLQCMWNCCALNFKKHTNNSRESKLPPTKGIEAISTTSSLSISFVSTMGPEGESHSRPTCHEGRSSCITLRCIEELRPGLHETSMSSIVNGAMKWRLAPHVHLLEIDYEKNKEKNGCLVPGGQRKFELLMKNKYNAKFNLAF